MIYYSARVSYVHTQDVTTFSWTMVRYVAAWQCAASVCYKDCWKMALVYMFNRWLIGRQKCSSRTFHPYYTVHLRLSVTSRPTYNFLCN